MSPRGISEESGQAGIFDLAGLSFNAAWMAVLLLSVVREVKTISVGMAPMNSATCARAVSITVFSFDPTL